jgi:hypothetical protein
MDNQSDVLSGTAMTGSDNAFVQHNGVCAAVDDLVKAGSDEGRTGVGTSARGERGE